MTLANSEALQVRFDCGHLADLGGHDREVVAAIGGYLAVGGAEELRRPGRRPLHVGHRLAALVEAAADHHQPVHQLGPLDRHQHRDERAVAVADQIGRPADDGVEEGDRVVGHELVGDRRRRRRGCARGPAARVCRRGTARPAARGWARTTARRRGRRAAGPGDHRRRARRTRCSRRRSARTAPSAALRGSGEVPIRPPERGVLEVRAHGSGGVVADTAPDRTCSESGRDDGVAVGVRGARRRVVEHQAGENGHVDVADVRRDIDRDLDVHAGQVHVDQAFLGRVAAVDRGDPGVAVARGVTGCGVVDQRLGQDGDVHVADRSRPR